MKNQHNDLPKLAAPAQRALASAGITRLIQLIKVTEAELLMLHGIGQKALGILRLALNEKGLSFREPKKTGVMEKTIRTNIVLDEDLICRAQKLTGIKTKREVVQEALRTLIRIQEQTEARSLRGKLQWEGNLDEQRQARLEAKIP